MLVADILCWTRIGLQVYPAFGNKDSEELKAYFRNGVFPYGPAFTGRMVAGLAVYLYISTELDCVVLC